MRIVHNSFRLMLIALVFVLDAVADDLPVHSEFECAVVEASVNGMPTRLLIDTGARRSGVDAGLRNELGLKFIDKIIVSAPSGNVSVPLCQPVNLKIHDLPVRYVEPVEIDLELLNRMANIRIDGIVGLDVLSYHVVVISDGKVAIFNSMPSFMEAVQERNAGNAPNAVAKLQVAIPTIDEISIGIDTGDMGSCRLTEKLISTLLDNRQIVPGSLRRAADANGVTNATTYIMREIDVAGVKISNVPVQAAQNNAIGLGLLRHLSIALDFPQHKIVIGTPKRLLVNHIPPNASGVAVCFDDAELTVAAVRPSSPAEDVGIQTGDVVVSLEGKLPAKLSIHEINKILAQNGLNIPVRLRRGSDEFSVELPLRLPFEYPPNWAGFDKELEDFEQFLGQEANESPK